MATEPDLYVGKEPATFEHDGAPVFIGPTIVVRAGHPILKGREHLFAPLVVHYDVESAKDELRTVDDLDPLRERAEKSGVRVDRRWGADRLREEIDKAEK